MRSVPLSVIVVGSDEEEELLLIGRGTRILVNVTMGIDTSFFAYLPRPRTSSPLFVVVVFALRRRSFALATETFPLGSHSANETMF